MGFNLPGRRDRPPGADKEALYAVGGGTMMATGRHPVRTYQTGCCNGMLISMMCILD